MTTPGWTPPRFVIVLLPLAQAILLFVSLSDLATTQRLFLDTTYYLLMATLLSWLAIHLQAARALHPADLAAWVRSNRAGIAIALVVTLMTALAVEPALRMLSDEANLAGTAKNLFASRTPTFTVSGKYYYDSFWDVDVAIDRRPALFPFLVSLVHALVGYSYKNVFLFNLLVLPAFVLVAYRLAKSLGGETFGVVAALWAAAHPTTLLAARSGGFDFFANFFALVVLKSFWDHLSRPSAERLGMLWMNLCLFAQIRYETALFMLPVMLLLLLFRSAPLSALRPYALLYLATPAFLMPRIWQAALRGSVPEQEAGAVTFSLQNFVNNAHEYFQPVLSPAASFPLHSATVIALGIIGCGLWLRWCWLELRTRTAWQAPPARFALLVAAWMLGQAVISFTYVWGRAQYPSAARLLIAFDVFFSFAAAWALTAALRRFQPS